MGLSLTDHKTNMYLKKEHKLKIPVAGKKDGKHRRERTYYYKINTYKALETVPGTR